MSAVGRLANKIAIITGGGSGIGRATVDQFVKHGARVLVVDLNEPDLPDGVEFVQGSVTADSTWRTALAQTEASYGAAPDVLVNAAGVMSEGSVLDYTEEKWNAVQAVNVVAPLKGMQAVIRALLAEKRPGSIVNVSSIAGERAFPFTPAYNTSKAAVSHLTRSAASEFGDKGIRINAVAPGMVLTGEFRPTVQRALTVAMTRDTIHERQGLVDHHTALKRVAAPEEMAASIVYLASDDASYITGHVLVNDGGLVLT